MVLTKLHLNEKKSMSSPVINVPVFSLSILLLAIVAGIAESGDFKSFSLPIHSFTFGDIWNLIRPYIFLSYKLADDRSFLDSLFGKGINDVKFIVGWIFILHQIQALLIFAVEISFSLLQITEEPTEKIEGDLVAKPRLTEKIAEQFYLFFFYLTTFTTGYMVYAHSEYYPLFVNSSKLWSLYPNSSLSPIHKAYYLIQASFWLHELVKLVALTPVHHRKKDHYPMIVHHIVTSSLLLLSYSFHFTSIGTVVLITFDIADLLLSVAKILVLSCFSFNN